ncbi:hypothetical protein [Flavobacterium geliluteum]|uniref:Uncharacterized protein n=1 Tax=Flavobacterium geliluteum TaxID=2816120 RepID=A0A941AZ07_9FLAO|nr:hypothetical protein [Flavobacterium geliluteum]MBP4138402.1 hypothetical protein [Flavobacterium geliluteum]
MTDAAIRDKVLELFKKERSKPDSEFDESHFLDFLTYPAHSRDTIKNSFLGVRKYYRFMGKLELEFAICFTPYDLDKYYSVNSMTKKIQERIEKKLGNLLVLKERNEEKDKYFIEILLIIILIVIYIVLEIHLVSIVLSLLFGITICWILHNKIHHRVHNYRLRMKILEKEQYK